MSAAPGRGSGSPSHREARDGTKLAATARTLVIRNPDLCADSRWSHSVAPRMRSHVPSNRPGMILMALNFALGAGAAGLPGGMEEFPLEVAEVD